MTRTNLPKVHEESYFLEEERRLIEKLRLEREERIRREEEMEAEKERTKLKALHWMCCPKCGHEMAEKDLSGVLVDICGRCEGIFFDRGEIEELFLNQQSQVRAGFFRRVFGLSGGSSR